MAVDDANSDGKIDQEELYNLLLEVETGTGDMCPDEVLIKMQEKKDILLRKYDRDKSGTLQFVEFVAAIYDDPGLLGTVIFLRQLFMEADKNDDGELDKEEVCALIKTLALESGLPPPTDTAVETFAAELFAVRIQFTLSFCSISIAVL
eukprot:SAG31_NODE_2167_length_6269_cov_4.097731_2_plen_149_part_00